MLFQSGTMKLNIVIITLALSVGVILPMLVGYFAGDKAVRSKSKLSHHFNGMLFGMLAYWIMIFFGAFVWIPVEGLPDNTRIILVNLLPSIAVALVTVVLAVAHMRSKQAKRDVLEYRPFSFSLIVGVVAMPVLSLAQSLIMNSVDVYSFVALGMVALFGGISYASLRNAGMSLSNRLTWSAVSVSVLYIAVYASMSLVTSIAAYLIPYSTMEQQAVVGVVSAISAVAGWIIYWVLQARALDRRK